MRNLRPEKIDSRASKASKASSPQRLRASLKTVSHRQRRSTNIPRLNRMLVKGSLGSTQTIDQSPPGLPTEQSPVGSQTKPRLQHRATRGSSTPLGLPALNHPPTPCQTKPKNFSRNNKKTTLLIKKISQQKHQHPTKTHRTPQPLNQTPQNTDSHMCVHGGGGNPPLKRAEFSPFATGRDTRQLPGNCLS